jgi:glutamate dehydrogenase (NADP+)
MPYVHDTINQLQKSSPGQTEFYQAAEEVVESIRPLFDHSKH